MLDLIRIRSRSGGKHWPEAGRMILAHQLASGLDPFGQKLTQSARTKSDLGWFCTVLSGSSVDKQNWVQKLETGSGLVASCQKLETGPDDSCTSLLSDQMCLAKPWPGHPDQICAASAQYHPCILWKNGAETNAGSQIQHILSSLILVACWP